MFDEIRDFVVKNKIWFIICGIIFAVAGAVLAGSISLYFLIAVAVGLIVAVVSGLVKNKEIKGYEPNKIIEKKYEILCSYSKNENQKVHEQENNVLYNQGGAAPPIPTPTPDNEELEKYKKEARNRITEKYVQELDKSANSDVGENKSKGSILIQNHGLNGRGTGKVLDLIQEHFYHIDLDKCSEIIIRGDIEVLFEVLTGVAYNNADEQKDYCIKKGINIEESGHGNHSFGKCFFEHTILCACALYKNQSLLKFDSLVSKQRKKLTDIEYCNWLKRNKPIISFGDWDKDHKHGSVLNKPKISNLLDQNQLE
ncbi:MAG: TRIC cation channel family protein [Firmicutes bacterium]|nr:TRIC cation channel family protein [Bacillota bacterium]